MVAKVWEIGDRSVYNRNTFGTNVVAIISGLEMGGGLL